MTAVGAGALAKNTTFQFPFHRDWLCDRTTRSTASLITSFQFPFHRDWLCDSRERDLLPPEGLGFQFPFHRDWLCDALGLSLGLVRNTTFSSLFIGIGFVTVAALQLGDPAAVCFQFPFHRDWLCDRICGRLRWNQEARFQFPFHRDWLCDPSIRIEAISPLSFQFPFHRDWLCDLAE